MPARVLHAGDDADAAGWFTAEELHSMPVIDSVAEIARELLALQAGNSAG